MDDYDDSCKDVDTHDNSDHDKRCNLLQCTLEKWRQQYLRRGVNSYCVYTVFNGEHYFLLLNMYNRYVNTKVRRMYCNKFDCFS